MGQTNDPSTVNPSTADNKQTVILCSHPMLLVGLNPPVAEKAPLVCISFLLVMKALKIKSIAWSLRVFLLVFQSVGHSASPSPKSSRLPPPSQELAQKN